MLDAVAARITSVSILVMMSAWGRVGAGLVLLLTMLVSPMAPVLCALSCPDLGTTRHGLAAGRPRAPQAQSATPCHDNVASAPDRRVPPTSALFDSAAWHQCQHPETLTTTSVLDGLRLPQPMAATSVAPHVSESTSSGRPIPLTPPARMETARHVSGFSLALRI